MVNPPVWRASTHLYRDTAERAERAGSSGDFEFYYGRRGAPTQWALADALTALEPGAEGTVLYPSGTSALAQALLTVLRPGDSVLVADNVYEPTRHIASGLLKTFGIAARFFDPFDHDAYAAAFDDTTKAVMLESPGSLTMEVCDVPALAAIARDKGAVSLLDNTWATSLGFPALQHGCDIAITALTKHHGGHSDVMMGAASAAKPLYARLRQSARQFGIVVSPDDAALVSRGMRTMAVRLAHESETALTLARWLADRAEVAAVFCPMLDGAPGNDLWKRDFAGGCGLFSFALTPEHSPADRDALIDALELFGIGYSWGGFESLALPVDPAPIRTATSWPPNDALGPMVRLSIGLEDEADLRADLDRAFTKFKQA